MFTHTSVVFYLSSLLFVATFHAERMFSPQNKPPSSMHHVISVQAFRLLQHGCKIYRFIFCLGQTVATHQDWFHITSVKYLSLPCLSSAHISVYVHPVMANCKWFRERQGWASSVVGHDLAFCRCGQARLINRTRTRESSRVQQNSIQQQGKV